MKSLKKLLDNNKTWAKNLSQNNPEFFVKLSQNQKPDYLWIGCSDSRVPANQIVDLPPGEVFVHRNIANQFLQGDMNSHSVLQYAVEVLNIKDIILCGHYSCGGVLAAFDDTYSGLVEHWVENIKMIKREYHSFFDKIKIEENKVNALCELNVIFQVKNLHNSEVIRKAWQSNSELNIHGWIYKLTDGHLIDLDVFINNQKDMNSVIEKAINGVFNRYLE